MVAVAGYVERNNVRRESRCISALSNGASNSQARANSCLPNLTLPDWRTIVALR